MKPDLGSISSTSCVLTAKPDVDIWENEREKNIYFNNQKKREERHQQSVHSDAIKKAIRAQSVAQIYLCRKLSHFKPGLRTKWLATLGERFLSLSRFLTALQSLSVSSQWNTECYNTTWNAALIPPVEAGVRWLMQLSTPSKSNAAVAVKRKSTAHDRGRIMSLSLFTEECRVESARNRSVQTHKLLPNEPLQVEPISDEVEDPPSCLGWWWWASTGKMKPSSYSLINTAHSQVSK